MKQKLKNIGAFLLIAAILMFMLTPVFSRTNHSYLEAQTLENMRKRVEYQFGLIRKENRISNLNAAIAGAGLALLIVSYAMKEEKA